MSNGLDRYFYSIEHDAWGSRVIHLYGNIYRNDSDGTATNFRVAEWSYLCIGINWAKKMIAEDTFFDFVNERVDYIGDVDEDDAIRSCDQYFDGSPGIKLHISDITNSTPCGEYWFE